MSSCTQSTLLQTTTLSFAHELLAKVFAWRAPICDACGVRVGAGNGVGRRRQEMQGLEVVRVAAQNAVAQSPRDENSHQRAKCWRESPSCLEPVGKSFSFPASSACLEPLASLPNSEWVVGLTFLVAIAPWEVKREFLEMIPFLGLGSPFGRSKNMTCID